MKLLITCFALLLCSVTAQLLRPDVMNLGKYNPATKHYEKPEKEPVLGGDDHDLKPHRQHRLGGDGHDLQPHRQHILGGDDHDMKPHRQHLLGGDGHDLQSHRQHLLGGYGHDLQSHRQHLLLGDDHDLKPHRQHLLGVDGHDLQPHRQHILGGDDHDMKPHRQHLLGGDGHDLKPHRQHLLGGDDHDLKPHRQHLLGGDDHDLQPHRQHILGGDGHDLKPHRQHRLGGDDHDMKPHRQHILGGDDHDMKPHRQHILGGDDHDMKPHRQHILGGDDHDMKPHRQHILGGDDHDRVSHLNLLGSGDQDNNPHQRLNSLLSFRHFMDVYGIEYATQAEFSKRFSIFRRNMHRIRQFQRAEQGTATHGITKFADMSEQEFRKMLGFRPELRRPSVHRQAAVTMPDVELPASFDWRDHQAVTPVKNQGACGSCWAFSTTGNVEGQWALRNSELVSLSEQELVDCDSEDHGCEGGLPENAYDAVMKLGGLETEEAYPYNGQDGTCHMDADKIRVQVNGSVELPKDEDQLAKWLVKNGPISIGIDANALQFYTGGVSHPFKFLCNPNTLNHGMLIVGFGTHTTKYLHRTQPYWLVKNSWGTDWGEQGYYRVYRGDGTCGVNQMATSATVV